MGPIRLGQTPWLDFEESVNRYLGVSRRFQRTLGSSTSACGEGFTQAEANKYKSLQGRLTIRPLPGRGLANYFRISGFTAKAGTRPGDIRRSGWSTFIEPRQGPLGWAGVLRIESFDPNHDLTDNSHKRVIGGIAYWLAWNRARLGLVATNERVNYDPADGRADENRILLQTHVEF